MAQDAGRDGPGTGAPASDPGPRLAGPSSFLEGGAVGSGLLARLDPRGKVVAAFLVCLVMAVCQVRATAVLGLVLGLVLVGLSGIGPGPFLRRAAAVNVFVAVLWLLLPLRLVPGPGWAWPHPALDPAGLDLAVSVTLKVNATFLAMLGLLGTSEVGEILHALNHLRLPRKLVTLFFLFHRYLFVIHEEYVSLRKGVTSRGFRPGTDAHTYRTYAYLLGMLLVRSLDRADRVYQAMLSRGFTGTFWIGEHFHWRGRDTAFLALTGLALAAMAAVEWGRML
jgi:cobalt/nickel transport system permease protein